MFSPARFLSRQHFFRSGFRLLLGLLCIIGLSGSTMLSFASTTTTLAVMSAGSPVTTVAQGEMVTLSVSVTNGAPLTAGQVAFCDAAFPYCTDIHKLGTSQIMPGGIASFSFYPGSGEHTYRAIATFAGGKSPSNEVPLTVTPQAPPHQCFRLLCRPLSKA